MKQRFAHFLPRAVELCRATFCSSRLPPGSVWPLSGVLARSASPSNIRKVALESLATQVILQLRERICRCCGACWLTPVPFYSSRATSHHLQSQLLAASAETRDHQTRCPMEIWWLRRSWQGPPQSGVGLNPHLRGGRAERVPKAPIGLNGTKSSDREATRRQKALEKTFERAQRQSKSPELQACTSPEMSEEIKHLPPQRNPSPSLVDDGKIFLQMPPWATRIPVSSMRGEMEPFDCAIPETEKPGPSRGRIRLAPSRPDPWKIRARPCQQR